MTSSRKKYLPRANLHVAWHEGFITNVTPSMTVVRGVLDPKSWNYCTGLEPAILNSVQREYITKLFTHTKLLKTQKLKQYWIKNYNAIKTNKYSPCAHVLCAFNGLFEVLKFVARYKAPFELQRFCSTYIAPGGGRWYLIFNLSRRASSLYPSVFENRSQSSPCTLSLSALSVLFSHSALCHALSAKASSRGCMSECSCSGVLTVSLQNAPDMPATRVCAWD